MRNLDAKHRRRLILAAWRRRAFGALQEMRRSSDERTQAPKQVILKRFKGISAVFSTFLALKQVEICRNHLDIAFRVRSGPLLNALLLGRLAGCTRGPLHGAYMGLMEALEAFA